jgi:hypothetical protein
VVTTTAQAAINSASSAGSLVQSSPTRRWNMRTVAIEIAAGIDVNKI